MSNEVIVHKNRTNYVTLDVGYDASGDVLTSEIRSEPYVESVLLATWIITPITDGSDGQYLLTLDNVAAAQVKATSGFMDVKRMSGSEPLPLWDQPLEVTFRGTVTQ